METIVGIDLGTTNSAIAIMDGEKVYVIPNKQGNNTTPSVVAFTASGNLVGSGARNQAVSNPGKTIASAKRLIGRRVSELPEEARRVSYPLVGRPSDPVQILVDDKTYMPQDISAQILADLKHSAEEFLKKPITDVVITVPAYFNDGQRSATKKAGELAGFNVRRIINEPTAAALAYGLREESTIEKKIAVFDLGGGTFDISVLEIGGGVWEVRSTNGDTFLGGDDFDREVTNLLIKSYFEKTTLDLRKHPSALQKVRDAAEQAKCELSSSLEVKISLNFTAEGLGNDSILEYVLTRNKFETLLEPYLKRIESCCRQALKDASFKASDINDVVMVGGSTRIPIVRSLAEKIFSRTPNTSINPDEVVALGAAIQGAILTGQKKGMVLVDVTPLSLGLETEDEMMDVLIPKNTPIPCIKKDIFTTTEDDQGEVDVFIYQGENRKVTRNRLLGQFVLDGIEPTVASEPQIEVRFSIDADGILNVAAKNLGTGSEQHITIKEAKDLTPEEIQKMQNTADDDDDDLEEDDEDDTELSLEELTEIGESLLRDIKNNLNDLGEMLEKDVIQRVKTAAEVLAEALDSNDMTRIDSSVESLLELWNKIEENLEE
jgi:molecular chaperone DnaK